MPGDVVVAGRDSHVWSQGDPAGGGRDQENASSMGGMLGVWEVRGSREDRCWSWVAFAGCRRRVDR